VFTHNLQYFLYTASRSGRVHKTGNLEPRSQLPQPALTTCIDKTF